MNRITFKDLEEFCNYYWRNYNFQVSRGITAVINKQLFFEGLKRYKNEFLNMIDVLYLKGFFEEVILDFDPGFIYETDTTEGIKRKMYENADIHNAEEMIFYNYALKGVPDDYYYMYPGNRQRMVEDSMESLSRLERVANIIISNSFSFSLSNYEKLMCAYLFIQRKYMYSSKSKDNDIIGDAENSMSINGIGANNILKHLLEHLDFTYGDVIIKNNSKEGYHSAVFVEIKDRKYRINGCYVLDIGEDLKQSKYRNNNTYSLTNFCKCLNEYDRSNTIFTSRRLSNISIPNDIVGKAFDIVDSINSEKNKKSDNKYKLIRVLKVKDNN